MISMRRVSNARTSEEHASVTVSCPVALATTFGGHTWVWASWARVGGHGELECVAFFGSAWTQPTTVSPPPLCAL